MRAKTDLNMLNWDNMKEHRQTKDSYEFPHTPLLAPLARVGSCMKPGVYQQTRQPASLLETRESLRNEISRGKEYLAQVQSQLSENRELLEHWAQYEVTCSVPPLDHLVQSVGLKCKVEQFLIGWLARKQKELASTSRRIQLEHKSCKTRKQSQIRSITSTV